MRSRSQAYPYPTRRKAPLLAPDVFPAATQPATAVVVRRPSVTSGDDATPEPAGRALTEHDAVDIWVARWLRVRRKDLIERYRCDPRRIYEIWEGAKFPGSLARAQSVFVTQYPWLADRIDFGPHRRISRGPDPDQMRLFED